MAWSVPALLARGPGWGSTPSWVRSRRHPPLGSLGGAPYSCALDRPRRCAALSAPGRRCPSLGPGWPAVRSAVVPRPASMPCPAGPGCRPPEP
eukprot:11384510-Alexandrium_andersonii.AAC.1